MVADSETNNDPSVVGHTSRPILTWDHGGTVSRDDDMTGISRKPNNMVSGRRHRTKTRPTASQWNTGAARVFTKPPTAHTFLHIQRNTFLVIQTSFHMCSSSYLIDIYARLRVA